MTGERNVARQYTPMVTKICEGNGMNKLPYVVYMIFRGPTGGTVMLDKEASEKFMRRVYGHKINAVQLRNMAMCFANNTRTLDVSPYVEPRYVNYTMIAKSYRARKADAKTVENIADYIKSCIKTSQLGRV
jgi:hypothetical protein